MAVTPCSGESGLQVSDWGRVGRALSGHRHGVMAGSGAPWKGAECLGVLSASPREAPQDLLGGALAGARPIGDFSRPLSDAAPALWERECFLELP